MYQAVFFDPPVLGNDLEKMTFKSGKKNVKTCPGGISKTGCIWGTGVMWILVTSAAEMKDHPICSCVMRTNGTFNP